MGTRKPKLPAYAPSFAERAKKLCLLGLTDYDLAIAFGIGVGTLARWRQKYPDLNEAIVGARQFADGDVAESLYKRALGYDKNGKHYPADITACIFWLKNRQKMYWRDVYRKEVTGVDGQPVQVETNQIDLSLLNEDEIEMATNIGVAFSKAKDSNGSGGSGVQ